MTQPADVGRADECASVARASIARRCLPGPGAGLGREGAGRALLP